MQTKISLRSLDWNDVIVYFSTLRFEENITPKNLVDYFHFKYLDILQIGKWTTPNYLYEIPRARKILSLYGNAFAFSLIDLLFKEYNRVLGRGIQDVRSMGLALLSSDKYGWLMEKLLIIHKENTSKEKADIVARLLSKPRSDWTLEERDLFREITNTREITNA